MTPYLKGIDKRTVDTRALYVKLIKMAGHGHFQSVFLKFEGFTVN